MALMGPRRRWVVRLHDPAYDCAYYMFVYTRRSATARRWVRQSLSGMEHTGFDDLTTAEEVPGRPKVSDVGFGSSAAPKTVCRIQAWEPDVLLGLPIGVLPEPDDRALILAWRQRLRVSP